MVISYLMKVKGMSYEEALKLTKSKRSIVEPNAYFEKQLKEYEKEIKIMK